jgi:hypothetical protein
VYLALIPTFAFAYDQLGAGSFYDANIQREPSLRADAQALSYTITKVMNRPGPPPLCQGEVRQILLLDY